MPGYPDQPIHKFQKGALWISGPKDQLRIRPWPPKADRRLWHNDWQPYTPDFRLVWSDRRKVRHDDPAQLELGLQVARDAPRATPLGDKYRAFRAFRLALPDRVARNVAPFRSHQWNILLMTHWLGPAAQELLEANPFIAYALANNPVYFRLMADAGTRGKAARVLQFKQREILKRLKFPNTQAMVNLTRKMNVQSIDPDRIAVLRQRVADERIIRLFSHLPMINAGALELAANPEFVDAFAPKLLREVADTPKEHHYPSTARTLEEVQYMHGIARPRDRLPVFRSIAALQKYHDDLSQEFLRTSARRLSHCRIPRPPVPGTEKIIPITTLLQLKKEGKDQHNCVATYARRIAKRETYVYRVMAPERATLAIVKGSDGVWRRDQLKAAGNTDVSVDTRRVVDEWLAHYAVGVG